MDNTVSGHSDCVCVRCDPPVSVGVTRLVGAVGIKHYTSTRYAPDPHRFCLEPRRFRTGLRSGLHAEPDLHRICTGFAGNYSGSAPVLPRTAPVSDWFRTGL